MNNKQAENARRRWAYLKTHPEELNKEKEFSVVDHVKSIIPIHHIKKKVNV